MRGVGSIVYGRWGRAAYIGGGGSLIGGGGRLIGGGGSIDGANRQM